MMVTRLNKEEVSGFNGMTYAPEVGGTVDRRPFLDARRYCCLGWSIRID